MVRASVSQSGDRGSNPGLGHGNDPKNGTYCLLVWCSTLRDWSKEVVVIHITVATTAIVDVWPRVKETEIGAVLLCHLTQQDLNLTLTYW